MSADTEQLKLLSIFHCVLAGVTALFASIPIFHLVFGIAIVMGQFPFPDHNGPPPEIFGWMMIVIATLFIAMGWTFAICLLYAARCLQRRTGYTFCLIMAGLSCLFMPIGTCLGVFTIIVLLRPSVTALFENTPQPESEWNSAEPQQRRTETDRFNSPSTF